MVGIENMQVEKINYVFETSLTILAASHTHLESIQLKRLIGMGPCLFNVVLTSVTKLSLPWQPSMGNKMFRVPIRENYNFPGESVSVQMTRVTQELPRTVPTTVTATPHPSVAVRRTAPS